MPDPLPEPVPELRSEPDTVLAVTEVAHGGGLYDGQGVFFDARTGDGGTVRVVLPHTHVSAFIAQLVAFAGEAKKVRDEREEQSPDDDEGGESESRPDPNVEYTQMLNFQGIQISPLADLSGVAFQFLIQPGVTMVFPLGTRFLPQVAASLMKWHGNLQAAPGEQ